MYIIIYLQLIIAGQSDSPSENNFSLSTIINSGGITIIPIIILSIIALSIFIERIITINQLCSKKDNDFINNICINLSRGEYKRAKENCLTGRSILGEVIYKGICRIGRPIHEIESAMTLAAGIGLSKLEKNLSILGAIAAIAPMFGFLGTVFGMIRAFYNISMNDDISIGIIAGGIYEKMFSSAAGLIVGVSAYIMLTILNTLIERKTLLMEEKTSLFFDTLNQSGNDI